MCLRPISPFARIAFDWRQNPLLNCRLVSRQWNVLSVPYVAERIYYVTISNESEMAKMVSTVTNRIQEGIPFRNVKIRSWGRDPSFTYSYSTLVEFSQLLGPVVKDLSFQFYIDNNHVDELIRRIVLVLSKCPQLRHLHFTGEDLWPYESREKDSRTEVENDFRNLEEANSSSKLVLFPHLKKLSVKEAILSQPGLIQVIREIIQLSPRLEVAHISFFDSLRSFQQVPNYGVVEGFLPAIIPRHVKLRLDLSLHVRDGTSALDYLHQVSSFYTITDLRLEVDRNIERNSFLSTEASRLLSHLANTQPQLRRLIIWWSDIQIPTFPFLKHFELHSRGITNKFTPRNFPNLTHLQLGMEVLLEFDDSVQFPLVEILEVHYHLRPRHKFLELPAIRRMFPMLSKLTIWNPLPWNIPPWLPHLNDLKLVTIGLNEMSFLGPMSENYWGALTGSTMPPVTWEELLDSTFAGTTEDKVGTCVPSLNDLGGKTLISRRPMAHTIYSTFPLITTAQQLPIVVEPCHS